MVRSISISFILVLLLTVVPASAATGWLGSLDQALDRARAEDKMLLVDLYADWCGWCKQLEKEVFPDPRFLKLAEDFVLLRVDVEDGGEGTRIQERFRAYSLPTLLILTHDQVLVGLVQGYAAPASYVTHIQTELGRYRQAERRFAEMSGTDDPTLLRILAREAHQRGDGTRSAPLYSRLLAHPRVAAGDKAQLSYLLADSLRLSQDFEAAQKALDSSRGQAASSRDPMLLEAIDLLRVKIAQDQGDCRNTVKALEAFVRDHPQSEQRRRARRNLADLKRSDPTCA